MDADAMAQDAVFRALADSTRRALLNRLRERDGQTLTELCDSVGGMTRQSVTQHLDLLASAGLVTVVHRRRMRLHFLNPEPIRQIQNRSLSPFNESGQDRSEPVTLSVRRGDGADHTITPGLDLHVEIGSRDLRAGLERDLRKAVRHGRLKQGTRLPSSRSLAADLGVARNTVANAYAQLVAEGWFEAHRGRGTSVARDLPEATVVAESDGAEPRPRYDLRPGVPDVADFPRDAWSAAYRRAVLSAPMESLAYGDPLGHPRLRAALAAYLGRARGVRTSAGQIVVCNGATHGLSMLSAVLGQTGSATMAMESYGFPRLRRVATRQGLTVTALPLDEAGACVGRLWQAPAAAVLLTPAHQFPTGVPLSAERRVEVVEWARATGALVIEDDYDGEFRYDQIRVGALQAEDPDHVVYVGSMSKTLAPGLRLGWMAVPRRCLAPLLKLREDSDLHTGIGEQLALAEYIECGDFDRHLRTARLRYRRRREQLEQALGARQQPLDLRGVPAGLHGLIELPGGRETETEVVSRAAARGLALAGLSRFRISDSQDTEPGGLVIGYARPPAHAFRGALAALLDVLPRQPPRGSTMA
ncbi:aminotransferase class I/II-fold pyridoxal phosphate-dependent enzyme [Kribbella sp. NPDC026611]|uniref:MocR-like pyridoxine biosynthesis transcription factor PdxR n=1 Tax=Kribbella sp. NPDC026611 TaxID=3154911 RepID=UPI0033FF0D04